VKSIKDWAAYLREKGKADAVEQIRKDTRAGRPCGDAAFGKKIEEIVWEASDRLPMEDRRKSETGAVPI